jgi:septal ring factor EnvC (AmiA/AmiB activator)
VSELSKRPEILHFCSCYSKNDLFTVIDALLSSSLSLIRETFDSIPSLPSILSLFNQVFSFYQNQNSLKTLENQLKSLKSRVKHFESSSSKKQVKLKHSSSSDSRFLGENNHFKASSDWRKGDSATFKRNKSDMQKNLKSRKTRLANNLDTVIYPEWWLDMAENTQNPSRVSIKSEKITKNIEFADKNAKRHSVRLRRVNEKAVQANLESLQSSSSERSKTHEKKKLRSKESFGSSEVIIMPESYSSSSNSVFFPSSEMKKFYQVEFKRLFGNSLET